MHLCVCEDVFITRTEDAGPASFCFLNGERRVGPRDQLVDRAESPSGKKEHEYQQ